MLLDFGYPCARLVLRGLAELARLDWIAEMVRCHVVDPAAGGYATRALALAGWTPGGIEICASAFRDS